MSNILQVVPFEKEMGSQGLLKLLSTKLDDFLLRNQKYPKLLVPVVLAESREEG